MVSVSISPRAIGATPGAFGGTSSPYPALRDCPSGKAPGTPFRHEDSRPGRRAVLETSAGRRQRSPRTPLRTARHLGTCGVRHCAGAATQRQSAPRTMSLPGTPREARPRPFVAVTKQAAARPNSVVAGPSIQGE